MTASKILLKEHRYFDSEHAKKIYEERLNDGRPKHISPNSTLIACMGNHWKGNSYERVKAMADFAWKEGYLVTMYEEHDCCYRPYDALGVMRNSAYAKSILEGFEYILYCDNDVQPKPDALVKLLRDMVPIVSPVITYADGQAHGMTMPLLPRNQGILMVTSCVLSFLLFKTAVFLPFSHIPFWQDAIGADEEYHFRRLAMLGHYPFVDTNVEVVCLDPPHFPLDDKMLDKID